MLVVAHLWSLWKCSPARCLIAPLRRLMAESRLRATFMSASRPQPRPQPRRSSVGVSTSHVSAQVLPYSCAQKGIECKNAGNRNRRKETYSKYTDTQSKYNV